MPRASLFYNIHLAPGLGTPSPGSYLPNATPADLPRTDQSYGCGYGTRTVTSVTKERDGSYAITYTAKSGESHTCGLVSWQRWAHDRKRIGLKV
jgi:hypothetical protein